MFIIVEIYKEEAKIIKTFDQELAAIEYLESLEGYQISKHLKRDTKRGYYITYQILKIN